MLGAFYLTDLDHRMEKLDVKYFRYMDDILILATARWKLKRVIRVLNRTFTELKLEKHPDKTDMGRIEKGFDFLGYHFSPRGLTLADKTVEKFLEKALRISAVESRNSGRSHIGEYVKRWHRWIRCGLSAVPIDRKRYLEIVGKGPWAVRNHVHRFDKSRSPVTCTVPVGSPAL